MRARGAGAGARRRRECPWPACTDARTQTPLDPQPRLGPRLDPQSALARAARAGAGARPRQGPRQSGRRSLLRAHGRALVRPSRLVGVARLPDAGLPAAARRDAAASSSSCRSPSSSRASPSCSRRERAAAAVRRPRARPGDPQLPDGDAPLRRAALRPAQPLPVARRACRRPARAPARSCRSVYAGCRLVYILREDACRIPQRVRRSRTSRTPQAYLGPRFPR